MLMVAAFENYLKEVVAELLESINSATPSCDFNKLPSALQAQTVYTGLQAAMTAKAWDPVKQREHRLPGVMHAVTRIARGEILSQEIADTAGNPNAEQVKSMFKIIGVSDLFGTIKFDFDSAWGSPTAQTFIADNLDAVVQRRHVVAHTASILSTSRSDLQEWNRFLLCLVTTLDATLERHIAQVIADAQ